MIAAAVWSRRSVKAGLSLAVTVVLFIAVLPLISRAPWSAVGDALSSLTTLELVGLTVLWLCGLYAHTFVLCAAMPRLTHRRALTLSLTGSAVSNLVPLGGALGIGLNRHMTRTWGFSASAFALYTLVTNLWDVLTKLSLPALALLALLLAGDVTRPGLQALALIALALLVLLVVVVGVALGNDRAAQWFARGLERVVGAGLRLFKSKRTVAIVPAVRVLREDGIVLLTRGWTRLSLGMIAYSALQAFLLWACLQLFGSSLAPAQVFAGYAVERVLTIAVITPGGAGLVEVGITAVLVAFGGAPVATVAGVLVYRAFTFGLEIPVGVVGLALWLWHHRGGHRGGGRPWLEPQGSRVA
jgi:putative heme transporter